MGAAEVKLALIATIVLAVIVTIFAASRWRASGAKEKQRHAEEKQHEAEVTVEQAEEFDKSYRASRGRVVNRVRDWLRRQQT